METCDQCGPSVRAKVIVSLPSGALLTFCLSCTNRHKDKLYAADAVMYPLAADG